MEIICIMQGRKSDVNNYGLKECRKDIVQVSFCLVVLPLTLAHILIRGNAR